MHSDMFAQLEPEQEKLKDSALPPETFLGGPPDIFIFGNALHHILGTEKFEEVSDRLGVENYWPGGRASGTSMPTAGTTSLFPRE